MALVTVLTGDLRVRNAVRGPLPDTHSMASTRSWGRLTWLIRERPATEVVVDSEALPRKLRADHAVGVLRRRFPSLSMLFIARPGADPISLFRLGRAGLGRLVLLPVDSLCDSVERELRAALQGGTSSIVARAASPFVPPREMMALRVALAGALRGWTAEDLASRMSLTRPHLSVLLKDVGLPSTGHLLGWAKLLHAGRWLTDPGRSAESVSRQLGYSSGAAFRRALRTYVGATPTEVKDAGGLRCVLGAFLDACGFAGSLVFDRHVA